MFFLRYPAKICRVDSEEEKALIHFEGWNHRFDEWISFDSEKIRPSTRSLESKDEKTVRQPEVRRDCHNFHLQGFSCSLFSKIKHTSSSHGNED